jgi:hypothetical protein
MAIQTVYESKWYRKNRPSREECETNPIYLKLKFLRQNLARAGGRENPQYINVTLDYLLEVGESQEWKDPFTGEALEFVRGGDWGMRNAYDTRASNPLSCSIDRIDSDKGYVKDNVQLVTARSNLAKGNMSNKEFREYCQMVVKTKQ